MVLVVRINYSVRTFQNEYDVGCLDIASLNSFDMSLIHMKQVELRVVALNYTSR